MPISTENRKLPHYNHKWYNRNSTFTSPAKLSLERSLVMSKNSKLWLVSQEADDLSGKYNRPVTKTLITEFYDGRAVSDNSAGPIYFPVGYVIEHQGERGSSWREYDKGFAVQENVYSYPIISGTQISNLEGQLLTIIDTAFQDKEQRESVKSLVRNTLWSFNSKQEDKVKAMFESTEDVSTAM